MNTIKLTFFALGAAMLLACSKPSPIVESKEHAATTAVDAGSNDGASTVVEAGAPEIMPESPKREVRTAVDVPHRDALRTYLLDAMKKWAPARVMPEKDDGHYVYIASDIADVVLDANEKPIWKDDINKGRTATLVATIAFWESHFWKHVDDGRCNDEKWRSGVGKRLTLVTGNCDQGIAASIFQIHAYGGIALTDDGGWVGSWGAKGKKVYYAKDLLEDRRVAVRVALHIARASIQRSGTLCGYSGENDDGCPKARARLNFAQNWSRQHPFKL